MRYEIFQDKPLDEHLRSSLNCHFAIPMKKFEEKLEQEISYKLFHNVLSRQKRNFEEKMEQEILEKIFYNTSHIKRKKQKVLLGNGFQLCRYNFSFLF